MRQIIKFEQSIEDLLREQQQDIAAKKYEEMRALSTAEGEEDPQENYEKVKPKFKFDDGIQSHHNKKQKPSSDRVKIAQKLE